MHGDPVETEIKWRLVDTEHRDRLNARLAEMGALNKGVDIERNIVLDRQGQLTSAGCLLRLRAYQGTKTATLTWKGPRDASERYKTANRERARSHERRSDA